MAEILHVSGVLVGASERAYDGFTARDGGEVAGGVSRMLYMSDDPLALDPPKAVKVPATQRAAFDQIVRIGFGARLALVVGLFGQGDKIVRSLAELVTVEGPSPLTAAAAAAAGSR